MLISVEGNIGAGKTTFCKLLAQQGYKVSLEPIANWNVTDEVGEVHNVLHAFYQAPQKYACMFQTLVLRSRVEQCRPIHHGFLERCVHSDKLFGSLQRRLGNMTAVEYATYLFQFRQAVRDTPTVQGHIYIKTSVETCLERISKRAREGESGISKSYLQGLEEEHEQWFQGQENVLVIDGEVDFKANMDFLVLQVEAFRQSLAATPTFDVLYKE